MSTTVHACLVDGLFEDVGGVERDKFGAIFPGHENAGSVGNELDRVSGFRETGSEGHDRANQFITSPYNLL